MQKVVLLVRVSTENQEYDTQIEELKVMARRDGFTKKDDLIIIADKESGSTVDDDKREGLIKLDKAINDPDIEIKCVYVWELSRLSRKPVTLMSRIYDLADRKINFKTKELGIVLLDDNGNILPNTEVLLGMYIGMVKADSRTRIERIIRGKTGNALEGNYNGGNLKYGYRWVVDGKHKKYVLHPDESATVKDTFELYVTGEYGNQKLYKELKKRGHKISMGMISKILRCREYTGATMDKREFNEKVKGKDGEQDTVRKVTRLARRYPKIIEPYIFEECRVIAEKNHTNIQKSKTTYYAHRLIKCSRCGGFLKALKPKMVYRCQNAYNPVEEKNCQGKGGDSININVIDWLLWDIAFIREVNFRLDTNEEQIDILKEKKKDVQLIIDNSNERYLIAVAKKRKELEKFKTMSEKEREDLAKRETVEEKKDIDRDIDNAKKEIDRLTREIEESEKYCRKNNYRLAYGKHKEYAEDSEDPVEVMKKHVAATTDRERYNIIHKFVKQVSVFNEPNGVKRIEITLYNDSKPVILWYAGMKKDQSKRLYYMAAGGVKKYLDYQTRFSHNFKFVTTQEVLIWHFAMQTKAV
jgi:DNA invertase Pin-like site-specific DNA recombinase